MSLSNNSSTSWFSWLFFFIICVYLAFNQVVKAVQPPDFALLNLYCQLQLHFFFDACASIHPRIKSCHFANSWQILADISAHVTCWQESNGLNLLKKMRFARKLYKAAHARVELNVEGSVLNSANSLLLNNLPSCNCIFAQQPPQKCIYDTRKDAHI